MYIAQRMIFYGHMPGTTWYKIWFAIIDIKLMTLSIFKLKKEEFRLLSIWLKSDIPFAPVYCYVTLWEIWGNHITVLMQKACIQKNKMDLSIDKAYLVQSGQIYSYWLLVVCVGFHLQCKAETLSYANREPDHKEQQRHL
jgi:hypothetical protein